MTTSWHSRSMALLLPTLAIFVSSYHVRYGEHSVARSDSHHCTAAFDNDSQTSSLGRQLIVVKYGGSAITYKDRFESVNKASLSIAASQLAMAINGDNNKNNLDSSKAKPLIVLVHGAGSFGHFHAKEYSLKTGGESSSWKKGLALTRESVVKLNGIVVNAHIEKGLPVVGIPLFPQTTLKHRTDVADAGTLPYAADLLRKGLLPIYHGDVVIDTAQRCAIFSGDKILYWLCKELPALLTEPETVPEIDIEGTLAAATAQPQLSQPIQISSVTAVFLTDVAGVYDRPPWKEGAQLIKKIIVKKDGSVVLPETEVSSHDVTGGIAAKIKSAAEIAMTGATVYIVQVGTDHALEALSGREPGIATKIVLEGRDE